jgi:hypothetical protein
VADDNHFDIQVVSIYGAKTKQGLVELLITPLSGTSGLAGGLKRGDTIKVQMDLPKAREVLGMFSGAIEAAVSDGLLVQFLTTRIGLSEDAAARALLDFREMRQGSRQTVYPS